MTGAASDDALFRPLVSIVAAVALNRVIGVDNGLPWRLGSDLARFRALTMGKPLIMGRRTFESLPPARAGKGRLPGRPLVVMSRAPLETSPDDGEVVHASDLDRAIAVARDIARRMQAREIVIIGGGDVFAQSLALADKVHLTWVAANPDGDALFPPFPTPAFRETWRESHLAGERDDHAFDFVDYMRAGRLET